MNHNVSVDKCFNTKAKLYTCMSNGVTTISKLDLLHKPIELKRVKGVELCVYIMLYCLIHIALAFVTQLCMSSFFYSIHCLAEWDVLSTMRAEYEMSCFGLTSNC